MSPPLPPLRKLAGAIEPVGEHGLRLMTPLAPYLKQGAGAVVLSPVVGVLVGLLIALQLPEERHAGAAGLIVGGAVMGLLGLVGVGLLATAGARRRRSGCELDLLAGTVTVHGERPRALSTLTGLRVGKPSELLNWVAIIASGSDGELVLIRGVPPSAQGELSEIAEHLGARLSLPVRVPAWAKRGDVFGMTDKQAALACWLPFQGVFLFASAWYLWRGAHRPFVRHAARMSLLHFAVSIGVFLVAGLFGAAGWGLLAALGAPSPASAAPLMFALIVVWFWSFGSRIYGVVQAISGKSWAPLWVRPFAGDAPPPEADVSP